MVEQYHCMKCGHDFGATAPALGTKCPQCGVTFGEVTHADGRVEKWSGSSAYEFGKILGSISAAVFGVVAIIRVVKMLTG